jgi:hypothetical protein
VMSRAIHAYLGALAVTELNILTRMRKRMMSRAIYAYLRCDGVEYIDKVKEVGEN